VPERIFIFITKKIASSETDSHQTMKGTQAREFSEIKHEQTASLMFNGDK